MTSEKPLPEDIAAANEICLRYTDNESYEQIEVARIIAAHRSDAISRLVGENARMGEALKTIEDSYPAHMATAAWYASVAHAALSPAPTLDLRKVAAALEGIISLVEDHGRGYTPEIECASAQLAAIREVINA